jgi:GH15 family glucan-1,4-alpha-glucosidase
MALIEDYALIGDCRTAALVSREGSIDWYCCPRFDSEACFAALLGTREHGRWSIAPQAPARITRRYRPKTLVLETHFDTEEGAATLIDFMPLGGHHSTIVRLVRGTRGKVSMGTELICVSVTAPSCLGSLVLKTEGFAPSLAPT